MAAVSRRDAIRTFGAAAIGAAGAPALLRRSYRLFAQSAYEYSARAIRLVQESTVVDLLDQFRFEDYSERPPRIDRWLTIPGSFTQADADVYQQSGINVFALGSGASDFQNGLRFFAQWNGFIAQYPDWLMRVDKPGDFEKARANRKIGVMLTMQDSTHFRTPDDVDVFWGLGQRISQLTYNFNNRIGSGFLEQRDGGLSVFGLSIMERMQKVGMAVDVSHCGDQTTLDALDAAKRPVIFTHATCRALVPGHGRAKTDEAIRKMAKTGGVMGINFIRFMDRLEEPVTIDNVLDHFDYVRKLVGVQYVAVGSDVDIIGNPNPVGGGGFQPQNQPNFDRYRYHADTNGNINVKGLNHPKRMFDVAEGLVRRGYSDEDVKLILGGNAVRVLGATWSGR